MTIKQLIPLLPKVVKYNLKIIFAGKFIWFLLAAFVFFAYFMFQSAWNRAEINEGLIYDLLMFPCVLLVFYPAVFGTSVPPMQRSRKPIWSLESHLYSRFLILSLWKIL